jgi:predicted Zn-dependent protease
MSRKKRSLSVFISEGWIESSEPDATKPRQIRHRPTAVVAGVGGPRLAWDVAVRERAGINDPGYN